MIPHPPPPSRIRFHAPSISFAEPIVSMENRPQLLTEALLQPWDAPDAASPPKVPPCDGFPFASEIVSGSVDLEACAVQDATGFDFGKEADSWVAAIRVKRRLVSACLLLGFFFGMVW